MGEKTLSGYLRTDLKKGETKRLRREGKIPAIIYGHSEPVPIAVDEREFENRIHTLSESTIITIGVDGKEYDVLIKDHQEEPLRGVITHLDFYEIERGKKLRTHVPLHTVGTPKGVKEGGILEMGLHDVEIECLPKDIPNELTVDIDGMEIGDSRHVSDIDAPAGVLILTSDDMMAAAITTAKIVVEDEEGEEDIEAAEGAEGAEGEGEEESEETEE